MSAGQARDSVNGGWNRGIIDKEFVDAKIECGAGGQSFMCHQIILATSSPVFCAMFQADMREKETRKVVIEDIKPEVIALMLQWIYSGWIDFFEKEPLEPLELLQAADKYQLDGLKELCEAKLCSILDVTNVIYLLVFGDLHNATRLKNVALKMVARNQAKLSKTKVYQDFLIQFPRLAGEVQVQE